MAELETHRLAADRFREALVALGTTLEAKQNYNPNQPREPRGSATGGQWTRFPRGAWGLARAAGSDRASRVMGAKVDAFLVKHREAITRLLGLGQAAGGVAEGVAGGALLVGGGVTSETGAGVAVAAVGGWMALNGYDNAQAGWRALVTGHPQETSVHKALRNLGLSDAAAANVEILLGGGGAIAGARLSRRALDKAVQAELSRRTSRAFDPKFALDVRLGGRSLWEERGIRLRGDAWEEFDARRTGFTRYPHTRAFDQISLDGSTAVSNKTLDLYTESYLRSDRRALYSTLKRYIDDIVEHVPVDARTRLPFPITKRRLHLLLRSGDSVPGQVLQLAAAERYAMDRGVLLQVEYAR